MRKTCFDPEGLGEIDQAFSDFTKELNKNGHSAAAIFFAGLNNLMEFGYYGSPNKHLITQAGLQALAFQLERYIPVPDDDDCEIH